MITTPNLSLIAWNLSSDPYSSDELAGNWLKVDQHDHSSGKGVQIATPGIADHAITAVKLDPSALPAATRGTGTIVTTMINDDAVTAAKIATDAVGASEIASGAVGSVELASDAVTRSKTSAAFIQGGRTTLSSQNSKTLTWGTPFADNNYTVAIGWQATQVNYFMPVFTSKSASAVTVDFGTTVSGTLHLIGIHD